jgi:hypothetical protein
MPQHSAFFPAVIVPAAAAHDGSHEQVLGSKVAEGCGVRGKAGSECGGGGEGRAGEGERQKQMDGAAVVDVAKSFDLVEFVRRLVAPLAPEDKRAAERARQRQRRQEVVGVMLRLLDTSCAQSTEVKRHASDRSAARICVC